MGLSAIGQYTCTFSLVGLEAEAEFIDMGNNSGGGELKSTPPRTPGSLTRNSCNSAGSSGNSTKT